jgi:uncharacterized protein YggE
VYVPDVGYIQVGVGNEAKTAQEAWAKNGEAMRKIFAALKELGIDPKDVKTKNVSVNPKYFYPKDDKGRPLEPKLIGYTADYSLTVTVRRLDDMGKVCDALVENGANRNMSIRFGASDVEKALNEARARAVADARKQAELYTSGAGVTLGLVQSIQVGNYAMPISDYRYEHLTKAAGEHAPLPIAAGEQELTVSVTITWEFVHTAGKVSRFLAES